LQIGYRIKDKMEVPYKHRDFEDFAQRFYEFLDARKLSHSMARGEIVRAIFEMNKPFRIDDLILYGGKFKHRIAKSTIYANLKLLVEAGLITKTSLPNAKKPIFEKTFGTISNNYVYIIDTNKSIMFEDERIAEIRKELAEKHNLDIVNHSFTIYCKKNK